MRSNVLLSLSQQHCIRSSSLSVALPSHRYVTRQTPLWSSKVGLHATDVTLLQVASAIDFQGYSNNTSDGKRSECWTFYLSSWLTVHVMADQHSISNAIAMRESLGVFSLNSTNELRLAILSLSSPIGNVFRWEEHIPLKYHGSGTSTNRSLVSSSACKWDGG
jgi:hypothetical protein